MSGSVTGTSISFFDVMCSHVHFIYKEYELRELYGVPEMCISGLELQLEKLLVWLQARTQWATVGVGFVY